MVGGFDVGVSDGTLVGEEVGFCDVGLFVGGLVGSLVFTIGLSHAVFDGSQAQSSLAKGHESL